ncbi:MAG: LON peptidase substrate-binding domain-containing protein [Nitrospinae bacterium]|nr:LON peptidase substrate-binding domain-containing protein [Nitrospinota bacterium]
MTDFSEDFDSPVFPLPETVFYPKTTLSLLVFEPRYLAMVDTALKGDRLVSMANFQPGWEEEYFGNPAIREMVCVGKIVNHQRLADGNVHITLLGLTRARVLSEDFSRDYRMARLKAIPDASPGEDEWALTLRKAREVLKLWRATATPEKLKTVTVSNWENPVEDELVSFSYKLADTLKVDINAKIGLREAQSTLERLEMERSILSEVAEVLSKGIRRLGGIFYGFSLN